MDVSKFNEKLNKVNNNIYVIEETVTPVKGIYEAELIHDNANLSTLNVYTGSKLTGDKISNYSTSTPSLTPWKTIIKIFSGISPLYISYETTGDQVEAEDINNLQDAVVETQKSLNSEIDRAIGAEKVITDNLNTEISRAKSSENTLTNNLNSEITRAKGAESTLTTNLNSEIIRAKNSESALNDALAAEVNRAKASENALNDNINEEKTRAANAEKFLTDNLSSEVNRAVESEKELTENLGLEVTRAKQTEDSIKNDINANRSSWNDAYNKRHVHNNKEILDGLSKNADGDLTFNGGKIVSTTVNGLTDDVTIQGGNNITIVKEGNSIVVSAAGGQEKIVTNTPISILTTNWTLDTTVTPSRYNVTIQHNLNDSNILVGVYNGTKMLEMVEVQIKDDNSIVLYNYEAIDCKVIINSSGQPTEVIDNLDSSESNKALSAKQGKILKELINSIQGGILIGDTLANAKPISLFMKIIG
ncbi:hypothetical protein [Clostridium beijerinckii]|uniref:hypothetical protein n=1 Tax=Clostridium beijerinckii TaxID=1520 RepID=UPI00098CB335|nr:hypothetical protein [Clostridium beijerinckii]MBA8937272.1 hypothetical protein [Clostridium beijerinckii]NRU40262.1 hypothetical protein [Clostridium beijerinckii]NSA96461.1 hypothetical protein [Clostridium beijerinckii]OOM60634.1 hypothetical protein CLOBI_29220 [Clostridium beijerinckii]OOM68556.1 hypothetical protein CLBEIC_32130 [Clostridium beijerinckii]